MRSLGIHEVTYPRSHSEYLGRAWSGSRGSWDKFSCPLPTSHSDYWVIEVLTVSGMCLRSSWFSPTQGEVLKRGWMGPGLARDCSPPSGHPSSTAQCLPRRIAVMSVCWSARAEDNRVPLSKFHYHQILLTCDWHLLASWAGRRSFMFLFIYQICRLSEKLIKKVILEIKKVHQQQRVYLTCVRLWVLSFTLQDKT